MNQYAEVILNIPVNQSFTYILPHTITNAKAGMRAEVRLGNRRMTAFIIKIHQTPPQNFPIEKLKPVIRLIDTKPIFTEEQVRLAQWISFYYLCSQGEAISAMIPSGRKERSVGETVFDALDSLPTQCDLSFEQTSAVQGILKHIQNKSGTDNIHYVYGPTGSGKTEVFLKIAEDMLSHAKGIIYLVPEISLTKQVSDTITARFGNTVALLHSGLTGSQKLSEWNRILSGEARIVIGARSAVFAPVPNLGAIIIDEEHESAYKSDATPRYHARQVALFRCHESGIPLIMGSATPSAEAWYLMKQGIIHRYTLTKRLAGGAPPKIIPVNLCETAHEDSCLSPLLQKEIKNTLLEKRQTILFLNRRGFTHFFRCNTCGFELTCKNCSVALTYHKNENRLRCHYCGWSLEPPHICPQCASIDVGYAGFGTEYIEGEIRSRFPHAVIDRIDTDSLTHRGELQEKLDNFKNGLTDILLGTQMIAKGLNFPNLKLVGVILADTGLHLPDFRAAERTFSLITQVAGRAGRFFPDGKVIVQSYNPDREPVALACSGDIEHFYDSELAQRKMLLFPPFTRLIRFVFRSSIETSVWNAANGAAVLLRQIAQHLYKPDSVELLGPSECPLAKVAANYRVQILLRGNDIRILQTVSRHFLFGYRPKQHVYIEADTDPVQLL